MEHDPVKNVVSGVPEAWRDALSDSFTLHEGQEGGEVPAYLIPTNWSTLRVRRRRREECLRGPGVSDWFQRCEEGMRRGEGRSRKEGRGVADWWKEERGRGRLQDQERAGVGRAEEFSSVESVERSMLQGCPRIGRTFCLRQELAKRTRWSILRRCWTCWSSQPEGCTGNHDDQSRRRRRKKMMMMMRRRRRSSPDKLVL
eukprot:750501-Hanusia_phi.AAC.2